LGAYLICILILCLLIYGIGKLLDWLLDRGGDSTSPFRHFRAIPVGVLHINTSEPNPFLRRSHMDIIDYAYPGGKFLYIGNPTHTMKAISILSSIDPEDLARVGYDPKTIVSNVIGAADKFKIKIPNTFMEKYNEYTE
jgi:hypothetical protein